MKDSKGVLYCSFCGKSQHEVMKLIAGPVVLICDECVDLCVTIIIEERQARIKPRLGNFDFVTEWIEMMESYEPLPNFVSEWIAADEHRG